MKKEIQFYEEIPNPIEGPLKLPLKLTTDFKDYDDSFSSIPKPPQHDICELLNIDIVSLTYQLITENFSYKEEENVPFLRKSEYIASDYYDKLARRSEALKNLRLLSAKKEEDYSNYHSYSFRDIKESLDCKMRLPLFKSKKDVELYSFEDESLVGEEMIVKDKKIIINNKLYSANEMDMDDYLVVTVKDGVAYYSEIQKCLKIKK